MTEGDNKPLIEIAPVQSLGWHGLADAFAASGIDGALVETSPCLRLAVGATGVRETAHALETWLFERKSSLIPQVVDGEHIVLRPPAA